MGWSCGEGTVHTGFFVSCYKMNDCTDGRAGISGGVLNGLGVAPFFHLPHYPAICRPLFWLAVPLVACCFHLMTVACTNRTLFNDLIVGSVDNLKDTCSVRVEIIPAEHSSATTAVGQLGVAAQTKNISTFAVTTLPDTVTWLSLFNNQLTKVPKFKADNLELLYLTNNSIAAFEDVYVPPSVTSLALENNSLHQLVNVTLSSKLRWLNLAGNQVTRIHGVDFPMGLSALQLGGVPIQEFEIRERDVEVLSVMTTWSWTIVQNTCASGKAQLKRIKSSYFCVLPDDVWTTLYRPANVSLPSSSTNTSSSTTTAAPSKTPTPTSAVDNSGSSASTTTVGIVVAVVVMLIVGVAGFMYYRRKRNLSGKNTSPEDPTVEPGGSGFSAFVSPSHHQGDVWSDPVFANTRISLELIHQERLLGKGAFGEVYKGTCYGLPVAIKRLKDEFRQNNKYLQDFIKEAKLMASLDHPSIVKFIGIAGMNLTNLMVVFEFMDRGDLRNWIVKCNQMHLPTGFDRQRLKIAFNIANALTYLHSLEPKILHRDLKSYNILLNEAMEAKLTDFGISRQQSGNMTVGAGTMLWMAPEVMLSEQYDEKGDIFSFGVMLSELDTLDLPYAKHKDAHGRKLNETALMDRVARGVISVEFTEKRMPELVQLAKECVSLDPESRPAAAEVSFRLQQLIKMYKQ